MNLALLAGLLLLIVQSQVQSTPITLHHIIEEYHIHDADQTDDIINDITRNKLSSVITYEKSGVDVSDEEPLKRKVALLLVRKILFQGDILRDKQKEILDNMVANDEPTTCKACAVGMKLVQKVFNSNAGDSIISDVAVVVCHLLKIEDNRVCVMAVDEFKDMVFYLLFNLSPEEFCYWAIGGKVSCPKPDGFLPEWNVTIPNVNKVSLAPSTPDMPTPGTPTTRFLFFTDMHMDVRYKEGSDAMCGEPLCCRDNDAIPDNDADKAWKFGDYRNCDMPQWTVDGMMDSLAGKEIDFIIYTGDIPAHDVWNQTSSDQIDKIGRWTETLKKYFPNTPVYSSLGNHESAPVNSYPPTSLYDQPGANITWLYETVHKSWMNWIPAKDLATVMHGGFYTTLVRKGLRVVSLNTNYCSDDSWWLLVGDNSIDPNGQLDWFANVMQKAEDNGERVFIISHRPTSGCMKSWSWNYYDIVNRYEDNIIAQFFGHAHTDELLLYYDANVTSRVVATALIGPAFTTYSYKNAGYRIYTMEGDYDGTNNALLDGESYFLNISDANAKGQQSWQMEYSFSKDYQMKDLSPAEFQRLIERFEDDDDLFQLYHQHITKSEDLSHCDASCKQSTICSIKTSRSGDHSFCQDSQKL